MELVGHEDDETRSPTSFSSWVVHVQAAKRKKLPKIYKIGKKKYLQIFPMVVQ